MKVRTRFAPSPTGYMHIGNLRTAIFEYLLARKYDGDFILRIEDTDQARKVDGAIEFIYKTLELCGFKIDEGPMNEGDCGPYIQSERKEIYKKYAEELVEKGKAYYCFCTEDELNEMRHKCEIRNKPFMYDGRCSKLSKEKIKENLDKGMPYVIRQKMPKIGETLVEDVVYGKIKIDNSILEDQILLKSDGFPTYNFANVVDDHLMGMSHVLRGKDHLANSEKQKYLYNHMGWDVPEFIHYGRLKMEDIALSTSKALEGISSGKYSGWDDPRLGTLRAIARRGIQPQTIYDLITEIGVKMSDSAISWKKIYGLNRNFLEPIANRYFFVENPVEVSVEGYEDGAVDIERPLHADHEDRGNRILPFAGKAYLASEDIKNGVARLMDAVNVDINGDKITFNSTSFEQAKDLKAKIIQWVPIEDNVNVSIVMDDASVKTGLGEGALKDLKVGDVVQFERVGFARLDEIKGNELIFYYAHK